MLRYTRTLLTLGLLAALVPATAWSGAQARIKGSVVDGEGNPVKGAVITVTTKAINNYKKTIKVKDDGTFSFLILDATKHYLFHVEAPGYIPYEQDVKAPVGAMDYEQKFVLKTQQEMVELQQQKLLEQPGYKEFEEAKKLLDAGDKEGAMKQLEAAVAARPDLVAAWAGLARLRYDAGDTKGALAAAKSCLENDPDNVPCLAVAANSSKDLGDMEAHDQYLKHYEELNPDDPAAIFNEAAAFLNKMDDAGAKPLLEKCLKADPDYGKCLFEYGMLLLRSGDMAGAKKMLEHYLEVSPDGPDAAAARDTLKYL